MVISMFKQWRPKIDIYEFRWYSEIELFDFYIDWCEAKKIPLSKRMKLSNGEFKEFLVRNDIKPVTPDAVDSKWYWNGD